jgi:hypothetical protein
MFAILQTFNVGISDSLFQLFLGWKTLQGAADALIVTFLIFNSDIKQSLQKA